MYNLAAVFIVDFEQVNISCEYFKIVGHILKKSCSKCWKILKSVWQFLGIMH